MPPCHAVVVVSSSRVGAAGRPRGHHLPSIAPQAKSGAEGARLKEGIAINQSLSALGGVINALAEQADLARISPRHSP